MLIETMRTSMQTSVQVGWRIVVVLWCLAVGWAGCAQTSVKQTLDRHSLGDGDLLALLPRGQDALLDVDVAGLRQLAAVPTLMKFLPQSLLQAAETLSLPPPAQSPAQSPELVPEQLLQSIEAVVVGLRSLASSELEATVLVRGNLQPKRLRELLLPRDGSTAAMPLREVEYHGIPLSENEAGQAVAMLTSRCAAYGNRVTVRQIIDIFRGVEEGARSQADLMAALQKAPRAKVGRPAVLLTVLPGKSMRDRLQQLDVPELGADAGYLSVALAVGDGLDLGIVAGYPELQVAEDVVARLKARVQALQQRPALRFLGVHRFIEPLVAVAVGPSATRKTPEVHLAYRLPGDELTQLLERLQRLAQLTGLKNLLPQPSM